MPFSTYHQQIIGRLSDSNQWPKFERSDFLGNLNEIADKAFHQGTIEGYLASTFIYHQLTEEFIKKIIEYSDFLIQCSVFPATYIPPSRKIIMFGALLSQMEQTIRFRHDEDFKEHCKELNTIRIKLVHRLASFNTPKQILKEASKIKNLFDEIAMEFRDIEDEFREALRSHKKNVDEMKELNNDLQRTKESV